MPGMNVIRAAAVVLDHIQETQALASQWPNEVWYARQVLDLVESTLTLVRESCGSDAEIARLLKSFEMVGHEDIEDGPLTHRVVLTRQRVIEEQVITKTTAPDKDEALAATQHLLDGGLLQWKYKRTVETSTPNVLVLEESKRKE